MDFFHCVNALAQEFILFIKWFVNPIILKTMTLNYMPVCLSRLNYINFSTHGYWNAIVFGIKKDTETVNFWSKLHLHSVPFYWVFSASKWDIQLLGFADSYFHVGIRVYQRLAGRDPQRSQCSCVGSSTRCVR